MRYNIVVTYGVMDLVTLQSSFYTQTYSFSAKFPLLLLLCWVSLLIDLRYWLGSDFVDIKNMEVYVDGHGYTGG